MENPTDKHKIEEPIPLIQKPDELASLGVVKVSLPTDRVPMEEWSRWAEELSQLTPQIMAGEGDGEYAFYRNILDEPDFPFDEIFDSAIGEAILKHFDVADKEELRLDDAFCIHYNMQQDETRGAKHMDPSDITVNICLQKSNDAEGSHVLFYGTKALKNADVIGQRDESYRFLVEQESGYVTVHWGSHPHETTKLLKGSRTNIVLTYCYTDPSRSDVASRTCYT